MEQKVYSVAEVNSAISALVSGVPELRSICVMGEISNYKMYPSGHHYFTLKDTSSALSCVMFKGNAASLRFRPENGMTVLASGSISVYERDGKYQLNCRLMMPAGKGSLQIAFERLRAKLEAEGLFDYSHKKPLPAYPEKIAVITSPVGAAVRDVIRILGSRWPMSRVMVVPVHVQGQEAGRELAEAVKLVNDLNAADLIICGRGGGSAEDLWCFNDEGLARAVYASHIPVVSAVGHEPDVTIIDYVADVRASTPSNAAEVAVKDFRDVKAALIADSRRLASIEDGYLTSARNRLKRLAENRFLSDPSAYIDSRRQMIDSLSESLTGSAEMILLKKSSRLSGLSASLDAMSPLKVLARGYSYVSVGDSKAVSSVRDVPVGGDVRLTFFDGHADCRVLNKELSSNE